MSATLTITAPLVAQPTNLRPKEKRIREKRAKKAEILHSDNVGHWPRDILEAYARYRGPYTIENAETFLEEEPLELYNGWLVWQEMTNTRERRVVANINDSFSVSARKAGFGQTLADQQECLLRDGSTIKPDTSLISWHRLQTAVIPHGPNQRPTLIGCPELVVEVRFPSNRRNQEKFKRSLYFTHGTQIVWDVDEEDQVIWVYRAESPDQPTRFGIADEIDCEPLLPKWRRRLANFFAEEASAEAIVGEVADSWREEGAAQTLREVMPMLVRIRYGVASPVDLPERLKRCNLSQLQQLQSAIETTPTLEQWLAQLPSTG